ncbi:MAG: hypothetical protein AB8F78_04500 [Saprospiraceae bacterium]
MAKKKVILGTANFKSLKSKLGMQKIAKKSSPISYEISNELRNLWLEPITLTDRELVLIGLQFCFVEFKEQKTDGSPKKTELIKSTLPHLKVRQVYVDNKDGRILSTDAQNSVVKEHTKVSQLNNKASLTALVHLSSIGTSDLQIDNLYERLEFYPKNYGIDFVFFSLEKLKHFVTYYSKIHLSGCKISFGRKPSSAEKGAKHFSYPSFSLKIEGQIGTNIYKTNNNDEEDSLDETVFEGVTIGAPCPPTWYIYDDIIANLPPGLKSNSTVMQGIRARLKLGLSTHNTIQKPLPGTNTSGSHR